MKARNALATKPPEKLFSKKPMLLPGGWPEWFNPNGSKIDYVRESPRIIFMSNQDIAALTIHKKKNDRGNRLIEYFIDHGTGTTIGTILFNEDMLKVAFGIIKPPTTTPTFNPHRRFLDTYGGDAAIAGGFIKWKNYLNIPMPGTSMDNDPNFSIEVTPKIRKAIKALLEIR